MMRALNWNLLHKLCTDYNIYVILDRTKSWISSAVNSETGFLQNDFTLM